jgi:hypothetical protein
MKMLVALALAVVAVAGVAPSAFADQFQVGISVFARGDDAWRHRGEHRDRRHWRRDHRPPAVVVVPRHSGFIPGPGVGRYPARRPPVWVAPHWSWTGFGWAWIPGHWAR